MPQITFTSTNAPASTNGISNPTSFDVLKSFLGGGIAGPNTDALLAALASGDQLVQDNAAAAFKELFLSTADGLYLAYIAASQGLSKPPDIGMSDDAFRDLAITLRTNKLTEESFLEILEIFYGAASVRGNVTSATQEPFSIVGGDILTLIANSNQTASITFQTADFTTPGSATADEVAFAITRYLEQQSVKAYAVKVQDSITGLLGVQIISKALGLSSSIEVTGGTSQNVFQFPTLIEKADTSATWDVTVPSFGTVRYTCTGTTTVSLVDVLIGDYVNIFGSHFNSVNRGTFTITNVGVSYPGGTLTQFFEVSNILGAPQSGVVISNATNMVWFRPTKATPFNSSSREVIVSQNGNEVDIIMPATSQAVNRQEFTGSYFQPTHTLIPSKMVRDAIGGHLGFTDTIVHTGTGSGTITFTGTPDSIYDLFITIDGSGGVGVSGFFWGPEGASGGVTDTVNTAADYDANPDAIAFFGFPVGLHFHFSGTFVNGDTYEIHTGLVDKAPLVTATVSNNTLQAGEQIFVDGFFSNSTAPVNPLSGGYPATTGASESSLDSRWESASNFSQQLTAMNSMAIVLPNQKILVTGGNDVTPTSYDASYLIQTTGHTINADGSVATNFSFTDGPTLGALRSFHRMATLVSGPNIGNVLIVGGVDFAGNNCLSSFDLYNPTTNTLTTPGGMNDPRAGHDMIVLDTGFVFTSGGCSGGADLSGPLNSSESYNPTTGIWTSKASMSSSRSFHKLVKLSDGRILAIGGCTSIDVPGASNTCEIYDPTANTWAKTGSMSYSRFCHGAITLPNGNVLATGGGGVNVENASDFSYSTMEIFDPSTGRWRVVSNKLPITVGDVISIATTYGLTIPASFTHTVFLPNKNQVLVSNGDITGNSPGASVVIDINTFKCLFTTNPIGFMTAWAGPLSDGSIVSGGGFSMVGTNGDIFFYTPAADYNSGAGINNFQTITYANSTTIQFKTPDYPFYALDTGNAVITACKAEDGVFAGPFMYDTSLGAVAITDTLTATSAAYTKNHQYSTLSVANTADFPDETGYICFNFGYADQLGPIKYLGKTDSTTLILDFSYRFAANVAIGSSVTLLYSKGTWVPPHPENVGSTYLTDSPAGRLAAETTINSATAAGENINITITYPGDTGLGAAGYPDKDANKLSDIVEVFS